MLTHRLTVKKTGYFTHPDCHLHDMGMGHPECPQRLAAISDRLLASGVAAVIDPREAPLTASADLEFAHAGGRIVSCLEGGYHLDALGRSVEAHVRELADLS